MHLGDIERSLPFTSGSTIVNHVWVPHFVLGLSSTVGKASMFLGEVMLEF